MVSISKEHAEGVRVIAHSPLVSRSRTIPADTLTPIAAYAELATPGASCLLESVESAGGRISRYSFIGIDYAGAQSFQGGEDLLERVRAFFHQHRITDDSDAPLGGALFAFSYDAARPSARLAGREADAPVMPAAYVAVPQTWLVFDHFSDRLTIWAAGEDERAIEAGIDACIERLLTMRPLMPGGVRTKGAMTASLTQAQYLERVAKVKHYIEDGEVYQLQLGIRFSAALDGSAFDLYRAIRSHNPSPYMFYVDTAFGQLLGASPEFLVRLEGRHARIRPLAGTRPRGGDELEDQRSPTSCFVTKKSARST